MDNYVKFIQWIEIENKYCEKILIKITLGTTCEWFEIE